MKWVLIVLASLAGLVALVALIGMLVPRTHRATRVVRIRRPIAEVWRVIRDVAEHPSWRDGVKKIEILPPQDGKAVVRETSGFGVLTLRYEVEEPPRTLVTRILDGDQPFGGTWTIALSEQSGATRVAITEDGWISNPVFRFMARFVFGYQATLDGYLGSLAKKFGEDATTTAE